MSISVLLNYFNLFEKLGVGDNFYLLFSIVFVVFILFYNLCLFFN